MSREPVIQREVTVRPRRQITLPARVCQALGLETGDRLEVSIVDGALVVRPKRTKALEALRAIQRAFAESDVTEEELQEEGRRVRQQLARLANGEP